MPRETFYNLPDDKKKRVIEAALDEFSSHSYYKARITAIANKAGIAKGSFYQYFKDKKDLFKHIMKLSIEKKLKYINRDMIANKENYCFFHLLKEIYLSGIRFARENPDLLAIGIKLTNNKELQNEILGEYEDDSTKFFQQLLKVGLARGELDPEIDISLVSRWLTGLNYSLIDIIYKEGKVDLDGLVSEGGIVDKLISFIENGIKNRT